MRVDTIIIVTNNWMRGNDTIKFLGLWEQLHNSEFKPIEFDRFRKEAIKENLIPPDLTPYQIYMIYASEVDVLNVYLV